MVIQLSPPSRAELPALGSFGAKLGNGMMIVTSVAAHDYRRGWEMKGGSGSVMTWAATRKWTFALTSDLQDEQAGPLESVVARVREWQPRSDPRFGQRWTTERRERMVQRKF